MRFVSLNSCIKHATVFLPFARIFDGEPNPHLVASIQNIIQSNAKIDLVYNSGLTISPSITSIRERQKIIKSIVGAALNYHRAENNTGFMASAAINIRTDQIFKKIGFEPICENPYYILKTYNNGKNIMLRHKENNNIYREWVDNSASLWQLRQEVGVNGSC